MSPAQFREHGVRCRSVRKVFGKGDAQTRALRGVDFDARCGEVSVLVGPGGCGKTTLLSIIAGLLDRSSGELSVLGADFDSMSAIGRLQFRRRHLGLILPPDPLVPAPLCSGQQRRVAIAKALAHEPRLILCDEPTARLDPDSADAVLHLLATHAARPGTTMIVATQDRRMLPYAHCVAEMDEGRIVTITRPIAMPPAALTSELPGRGGAYA